MPVERSERGRRPSVTNTGLTSLKSSQYQLAHAPLRPVICTFAPNLTPITFENDPDANPESSTSSHPASPIFPPCEPVAATVTAQNPPPRKRVPPGKRRSMGYIPRPPNAFMLFRADFVRQKHVPGSIETNHSSLSKIIGNCWRALPLEEKASWEAKAKVEKAEHKRKYPEYRFRPVHNKNKEKKEKATLSAESENRCEKVANLLLKGMKGDKLAAAVREIDEAPLDLAFEQPLPGFHHPIPQQPQLLSFWNNQQTVDGSFNFARRPSSVPLPDMLYNVNEFSLNAPFITQTNAINNSFSRSATPVGGHRPSLSRSQRMMYGQRRASTVQPIASQPWGQLLVSDLDRDTSPLPDVDTSLFQSAFLDTQSNLLYASPGSGREEPFSFNEFMNNLPVQQLQQQQIPAAVHPAELLSPLEVISPNSVYYQDPSLPKLDTHTPWPNSSGASTSYSSSPSSAFSESQLPLHAPQAHRALPMTPDGPLPTFEMNVWQNVAKQDPNTDLTLQNTPYTSADPQQLAYDAYAAPGFDASNADGYKDQYEVQQHQQPQHYQVYTPEMQAGVYAEQSNYGYGDVIQGY